MKLGRRIGLSREQTSLTFGADQDKRDEIQGFKKKKEKFVFSVFSGHNA